MKIIIAVILFVLGFLSLVFACIMQCVVSVQMFGVVLKQVFIPHWSAWFFFGAIPMLIGDISIRVL